MIRLVWFVFVSFLFCFFLNISEIFLQPCVGLEQTTAAGGVCTISKNTQCGCRVFFLLRIFFCKSKLNTFLKLKFVDEIEAGALLDIQPKNLMGL